MSGVGFLVREMHQRGIRVRSGPYGVWTAEGFSKADNVPDDAHLLRSAPDGSPGLWWVLEAKKGDAPLVEFVDKRHRVVDTQEWTRDWESAAGTLTDSINSMHWVFEVVLMGEIKPDRHEWLCCDVCDQSQCLPKKYGAASQKRKCHMTPNCAGFVRRLPDIWSITHPKSRPKPRKPKAPRTPGAARIREKLHLDEDSADTAAA